MPRTLKLHGHRGQGVSAKTSDTEFLDTLYLLSINLVVSKETRYGIHF